MLLKHVRGHGVVPADEGDLAMTAGLPPSMGVGSQAHNSDIVTLSLIHSATTICCRPAVYQVLRETK